MMSKVVQIPRRFFDSDERLFKYIPDRAGDFVIARLEDRGDCSILFPVGKDGEEGNTTYVKIEGRGGDIDDKAYFVTSWREQTGIACSVKTTGEAELTPLAFEALWAVCRPFIESAEDEEIT